MQIYLLSKVRYMQRYRLALRMLVVYFLLVNIFASLGSPLHSHNNNYHKAVLHFFSSKKNESLSKKTSPIRGITRNELAS